MHLVLGVWERIESNLIRPLLTHVSFMNSFPGRTNELEIIVIIPYKKVGA